MAGAAKMGRFRAPLDTPVSTAFSADPAPSATLAPPQHHDPPLLDNASRLRPLSILSRVIDHLPRVWRIVRAPFWLALGLLLGFGVPYVYRLDRLVSQSFAELRFDIPSRVYARPLPLAKGLPMTAEALQLELDAARYREEQVPIHPGTFRKDGNRYELATRAYRGPDGAVPARRIAVKIASGRISELVDTDTGQPIESATVDPARIATYYGSTQEERKLVRLDEVPPILVNTLLAVEDRDFLTHHGIDPTAILRAAWVDITRGELAQGGSTITQQLIRNLFLDRGQRISRKLNEMIMAILIEARFDKQRILEAYLNEVYLGQQGAQAVHGMAAACEFYFGHDLGTVTLTESALLVGLIQGPSLYDPRRAPERAKQRREIALAAMESQGLISKLDRLAASKQDLGVTARGAIDRSRYPAFLDLVREQLAHDYPDARLDSAGFSIHTTLAPSTQALAERSVAEQVKALEKPKKAGKAPAPPLQSAMVVTRAADGSIEALVGSRNPNDSGFNRAAVAVRPIGSLVKPFVYLVALAQPERYSLVTPLDDSAVELPLPGGRTWRPDNVDKVEHGVTPLLDALAHSYNLATVRLGLELDVARVRRVLEALVPGARVNPNPSLLLGATELSPLQVTQAYQYLASDGHPLPLRTLDAVLDANGTPLRRYTTPAIAGDLVAASRLVSFALQETARSGTAHALVGLGLGGLNVAGKTGTSNDQRDSWFAGYTGSHLAVAWVGTDDNLGTGLFGSTGALKVWAGLFQRLPTEPLKLTLSGDPALAWVDVQAASLTDAGCPGARELPFIQGYEPESFEPCDGVAAQDWHEDEDAGERDSARRYRRESLAQKLKRWFDRDDDERRR